MKCVILGDAKDYCKTHNSRYIKPICEIGYNRFDVKREENEQKIDDMHDELHNLLRIVCADEISQGLNIEQFCKFCEE